jgi:hypothetical protein
MKSKKRIVIGIIFVLVWVILLVNGFENIIGHSYDEIKMIKARHPGDGRLYVTEDEELIDMFISMMMQSRYLRFIETGGMVGVSKYRLYSDDNEEIICIDFPEKNRVNINRKHYIILKDIENDKMNFYNSFWIEENVK